MDEGGREDGGSRMGGKEGWLDDGSDSLTWRGEEPHKSPVASAECHTAPDSDRRIFLFQVKIKIQEINVRKVLLYFSIELNCMYFRN